MAFVVKEENANGAELTRKIKNLLETSADSYEMPVEYIYLEELPRTLIGKVDFRKLEKCVG